MHFIIYFWYSYNYIFIEHDVKIHRSNCAHKYMYTYSFFVLWIELRVARMQTKFYRYAACNTWKAERARITGYWVSTDTGKGHETRHCPREWCNSETTEQIWIKFSAATLRKTSQAHVILRFVHILPDTNAVRSFSTQYLTTFFFLIFLGWTDLVGLALLYEVARSLSDTPHSVGLLWTSDRHVAENSTWQQTTLTTDRHLCPPAGFEPPIPASERPHTHTLDREAPGIGPLLPYSLRIRQILNAFVICTNKYTHTHTHTHTHIYIYILNYINNSPTCFGASAPSSGSFDTEFDEVIKY